MKTPIEYFNDGLLASEQGLSKSACPLIFQSWPRRSWEAGYDFGHLIKGWEFEPESELVRVPAVPLEQGANAWRIGRRIEDCPYGLETQDGINWRIGFEAEKTKADPGWSPAPVNRVKTFLFIAIFAFLAFIVGTFLTVKG